MTRALLDSATYLSNRYPYMAAMTETFASNSPEYSLFEGSLDYYDRNKPIPWDMVTLWVSSAFSLIFLTITLFQYYPPRRPGKN